MSRPPVNFQDLLDTIADTERNANYNEDHKFVIRTIYTQNDIENMTSSQRVVWRQALAYMIEPETWRHRPGAPPVNNQLGQTDYWWANGGDNPHAPHQLIAAAERIHGVRR